MLRSRLRRVLGPLLRQKVRVWRRLIAADESIEAARHTAARAFPAIIRPQPRRLEVAITSFCNLRCIGCRYGRDFMTGTQLSWPVVRDLLDDAREIGVWDVRFYGGEPLLHPALPQMVEYAVRSGLQVHVTTNAILLADRIDDLYGAGLRRITVGFYGTGASYDGYVQTKDRFCRLEAGIAAVRERYGDSVAIQINWLLMRPSCNLEALHAALDFAVRYGTTIQVDLIHYSLPYFTEGPDRQLQFRPEDRGAIDAVVNELIRLRSARPKVFTQSLVGLQSIPDWLLKGPDMRVPCDSYQTLWVGPDGTVQQCYVTFRLGNLHTQRLKEMVFTPLHHQAARDAFAVNCPNCHCHYDRRVRKDSRTARCYGARSESSACEGRAALVSAHQSC